MTAPAQLLAQGVECEDYAAAVIRLIEIATSLLGGNLAQGIFDQFLVGAGEIFANLAVNIFNTSRPQDADVSSIPISKFDFVLLEKTTVDAGLRHGLAAYGVSRNVIPEVDSVGEMPAFFVSIAEKILK